MKNKDIVIEYFKLVQQGKFKEGLKFFATDCKTHNPFAAGSMSDLADAQMAASKGMDASNIDFSVKNILSDGNLVAAHTQLLFNKSKPADGGLTQVHLFRFKGCKIVEYWDVTQQVLPDMLNASGAF